MYCIFIAISLLTNFSPTPVDQEEIIASNPPYQLLEEDSNFVENQLSEAQKLVMEANYELAIEVVLDALVYAQNRNQKKALIEVNNYLGVIFMSQGNAGLSSYYFKEALNHALAQDEFLL